MPQFSANPIHVQAMVATFYEDSQCALVVSRWVAMNKPSQFPQLQYDLRRTYDIADPQAWGEQLR